MSEPIDEPGGDQPIASAPTPIGVPPTTPQPIAPKRRSGMALAALVLGVLGFLTSCVGIGFVLGLIALILGIVALTQIDDPARGLTGRGMAATGTILGGASIIIAPVLALLIGIMLPALGAARRAARQMQNNTQVRGIYQSMVTYAQGNNQYYPGLDRNGNVFDVSVEARYEVLLDGNYFTGDYALSPVEASQKIEWLGGSVTADNYSYALLAVSDPGGRRDEWRDTLNTDAIVISDRNTGGASPADYQSIHTTTPGDWRGGIGWNDGHVAFEASPVLPTRYAGGSGNAADDLFDAAGPDDALMIHTGD